MSGSGSDPVYLTRNSAEWVKREQLQRRALPSALAEIRRGAIDRPPGGLWVFGEVLAISADQATVKVLSCNAGYNPSVKREVESVEYDTIICDFSDALDQDSLLIITPPIPVINEQAWFQLCHVPGEKKGDEWSPPRWWRVAPQGCLDYYRLDTGVGEITGTFDWQLIDQDTDTIAASGTFTLGTTTAVDLKDAIDTALGGDSDILITGGELPGNTISIHPNRGRTYSRYKFEKLNPDLTPENPGQYAFVTVSSCCIAGG